LRAIAEKGHSYQSNYRREMVNDFQMLNLAGLGIAFHAKPT
jgi:hypothetical protein